MPTSIEAEGLAERLAAVDSAIADAARAAGRDPLELTRIVVTKFQPAELVRELAALGVRDVGENRHQDAAVKAAELDDLGLNWHFVGQLQSNKAKAVRRYAHAVHSVDRTGLADALAGDPPLDVFLELNLTGDPGRGGVDPAELEPLAEHVLSTGGLVLRGVMAVAPLGSSRVPRSSGCARHPKPCSASPRMPSPSPPGCPAISARRSSRARHTCASARQSPENARPPVNLGHERASGG